MSKLNKKAEKEKLVIQEDIVNRLASKYACTCLITEMCDDKLYEAIVKLLNKKYVPMDEVIATLKVMVYNLHFQELVEEGEFEI